MDKLVKLADFVSKTIAAQNKIPIACSECTIEADSVPGWCLCHLMEVDVCPCKDCKEPQEMDICLRIHGKDPFICALCGYGPWDGCQCPLTKEEVLELTSDDFGEEVVSRYPAIVYVFKSGRIVQIPYSDSY